MPTLGKIPTHMTSRRGALALIGQATVLLAASACGTRREPEKSYKPVLYLCSETMTDVTVELDYDGRLTYTYPQPEQMPDGTVSWAVTAHPDGDLTDASGRH